MNMNRKQSGYTLMEVAIVLLIISFLGASMSYAWKNWMEKAAYISETRNSGLDELIALDRGEIDRLGAPLPDAEADPADPEVTPDPDATPDPDPLPEVEEEIESGGSWWLQWKNWMKGNRWGWWK